MRSIQPTGTVEKIKYSMEVIHDTVNTAESGTQSTPKNKWYSSNICSYFNSDIQQNQK